MCGVGGAVALAEGVRVDPESLERMGNAMRHRGPDDHGLWLHPTGRVGLVHRRLSIIDLEGGHQPLSLADGSGVIAFNGEIYNYRELRDRLEAAGHAFATRSDTEVLLLSYKVRGPAALQDLTGMFAFAIWDEPSETLFLARDRLGKKPLYYSVEDGCLYFASTLGALVAGTGARRNLNLGAVDDFLDLGYIPPPATIFEGAFKLPAAHSMTVDARGIRVEQFWDLNAFAYPFEGSFESAVDRLDQLLNRAVSLRLRSDVPLGVFLSGGIDSSLVAALAVRQAGERVRTFSIGFSEQDFDESGYAEEVARRLGTEHRAFFGEPKMLEMLPNVVRHFGEPFGDSSSLNVWLLAEETRRHVTVALGGDGGDEGFAGYPWYWTFPLIQRWRDRLTPKGAQLALKAVSASPVSTPTLARFRRALRAVAATPSARFGIQRTFLAPEESQALLAGDLKTVHSEAASSAKDWIARLYDQAAGTPLQRMRSADIASYLADCLLPKVDVATMAHGLEARAPLLDHTVLEFAHSLPDAWLTNGLEGKRILRAVLDRYLPRELFDRPKMGFSVPLDAWFSSGADGVIHRIIGDSALLDTGWIRREGVLGLVSEHRRGTRDHSQRLYNLLVLDEWLTQNGG